MISGAIMDDAVAAERLDAQIQAVLDFHNVFSSNKKEKNQVGANDFSMSDGDVNTTAGRPSLDARKLQKLASIRDIMSRERCFDAESRAESFRCILGNHRDFSLENFLEAVDEFDDDLFDAGFDVPTIELPHSYSTNQDVEAPSLLPADTEENARSSDMFYFPPSPACRSKRNTDDCDFNPFEDIDKRLKALKEARLSVKLIANDASNGDWSDGNASHSHKPQKKAMMYTSSKASVVSHSSSSEGSQNDPARDFKPVRRRSSTSTRASNLTHESTEGSTAVKPTRAAPRKIQRGAGASEVIRKHLEKQIRGEGVTPAGKRRLLPSEQISTIHEVISMHLESKILRTVQSTDSAPEAGTATPTTLRRTARRFANRKSLAQSNDTPTSNEVSKALEVLTKHLEGRLRAQDHPTNSSPLRAPVSPSRRRRTVTAGISPQSVSHSLREASLSSGLDLSQSKLSTSPFDPVNSASGPGASSRRSPRRQTARTRSTECADSPPLSPARTVKSQSSMESFGQRSSSPSGRTQRSSKLHMSGISKGALPSPAGRAGGSAGGSAQQSHAALVIKEHLERLQMRHQHTQAFQVMSEWANENTSDRADDPFCLDNVRVGIPVHDQIAAIPDVSDTDATVSERSEDPFQMSYVSGITNGARGAASAAAGSTPRRKATSRRVNPSKVSSRNRRSSVGGGAGGESQMPAPIPELFTLPELSTLGTESDDSKHQAPRESSREESSVIPTATTTAAITPTTVPKIRSRRQRSVSPLKRKPADDGESQQPKGSEEEMTTSGVVLTAKPSAKPTATVRPRQHHPQSHERFDDSPIKRKQMESDALAALLLTATTTTKSHR